MEQLLSGNTESSSTGTHGAAPSFCCTRSTEQLHWRLEHYGVWRVIAHMAALLPDCWAHICSRYHSVTIYSCSTGAHGLSSCFHGEHRVALLEHVEQQLTGSKYCTAAPLEHNEQLLPQSTESSYAGECGSEALWEQIQVLQWSIMEQQLPRSTQSSSVGVRGAAAL